MDCVWEARQGEATWMGWDGMGYLGFGQWYRSVVVRRLLRGVMARCLAGRY